MEEERILTNEEIDSKAKELADKLYKDNKEIIDETLDEEKEVYDSSKKVEQVKPKKKKHLFLKLFGISAILLILILVVSNVLASGKEIIEKTGKDYLGYCFYGLVGLLLIILVIIPTIEIFCLPSYKSLFAFEDDGKDGKVKANVKKILMITKKHQEEWLKKSKQPDIDKFNENIKILKESKEPKELQKAYHYINRKYIKQDVLKIVTNYANKVFISTAAIQSGKIDSLVIFTSFFKMATDVLKYCGFRISFVRLCKLAIHVLTTILAATKLNDIDFTAIFPNTMMDSLSNIPGAKVIVNSLSDGVANALLFFKAGAVLEECLLSDNQNPVYQFAVSIKETAKYMLVGMVGEIIKKIYEFAKFAVKSTISGVTTFFTNLFDQIKPKTKAIAKE